MGNSYTAEQIQKAYCEGYDDARSNSVAPLSILWLQCQTRHTVLDMAFTQENQKQVTDYREQRKAIMSLYDMPVEVIESDILDMSNVELSA